MGVQRNIVPKHDGNDTLMKDRKEVLECLIANHAFASSKAAFAREVMKQTGRMNLYRLDNKKAEDKMVDTIWNEILDEFGLSDADLYNLERSFSELNRHFVALDREIAEHPARAEYMVALLADGRFDALSEEFNSDTALSLNDLRADNPDAYWGFVTMVYIRAKGINVYKYIRKGEGWKIIGMLDRIMLAVHPERSDAHDAAVSFMQFDIGPGLWNVIHFCVAMLRLYTEKDFKNEMIKVLHLFGFGERSYWLTPGTVYREGAEVWVLSELRYGRKANGHYFAMRLKAGKDIRTFTSEDAFMLGFWEVNDNNGLPVMQACHSVVNGQESRFYLYGYDGDKKELSLSDIQDTEQESWLPETLHRLDADAPRNIYEKVWIRLLDEWYDEYQGEAVYQRAREDFSGWKNMDGTYRVKNVTISKTALTLQIESRACVREYSLPVDRYAFLSEINPSQTVTVVQRKSGGDLYVAWPGNGSIIKLDEFE